MRADLFDFNLPADRIAERPVSPRDSARLLHITAAGHIDRGLGDMPRLLKAGDVMVFNDTRVIPARLFGHRGAVAVELLLLKQQTPDTWHGLSRPAKRLKPGQVIEFPDQLAAEILGKGDGTLTVRFNRTGADLMAAVAKIGHVPLPPYIRRGDNARDRIDYQTVYAARDGAVAAPTAGLHFTPALLTALEHAGIARAFLTLHVGAGTFLSVSADDTTRHVMHAEWGEVGTAAAETINAARRRGGRLVAVGTTSLRLLESVAGDDGIIHPFSGETSLFISPGYRFKTADMLMTNFHLPRSTLFMLVCAFAGMERMRAAYAHAIATGYRFYSYGDACLLERNHRP